MSTSSQWASGEAYQRYMGRWSRLVAGRFLEWLSPHAGGRWLDVGCGAGALTATILANAEPDAVFGIDPSEPFVAYARETIADERAKFEIGDAMAIPLTNGAVDFAVSGLCLNFVPEAEVGVSEMARVTRDGGRVAAYVWDYAGGMQMVRHFWDAARRVDPGLEVDEAHKNPICAPEPLRALFEGAGLGDVDDTALEIEMRFTDFNDYWGPFGDGTGPAPAYLRTLSPSHQRDIADTLRATLPTDLDGTISLRARAWAVRGMRA